jgi:hypothetical protein
MIMARMKRGLLSRQDKFLILRDAAEQGLTNQELEDAIGISGSQLRGNLKQAIQLGSFYPYDPKTGIATARKNKDGSYDVVVRANEKGELVDNEETILTMKSLAKDKQEKLGISFVLGKFDPKTKKFVELDFDNAFDALVPPLESAGRGRRSVPVVINLSAIRGEISGALAAARDKILAARGATRVS